MGPHKGVDWRGGARLRSSLLPFLVAAAVQPPDKPTRKRRRLPLRKTKMRRDGGARQRPARTSAQAPESETERRCLKDEDEERERQTARRKLGGGDGVEVLLFAESAIVLLLLLLDRRQDVVRRELRRDGRARSERRPRGGVWEAIEAVSW